MLFDQVGIYFDHLPAFDSILTLGFFLPGASLSQPSSSSLFTGFFLSTGISYSGRSFLNEVRNLLTSSRQLLLTIIDFCDMKSFQSAHSRHGNICHSSTEHIKGQPLTVVNCHSYCNRKLLAVDKKAFK